MKLKLIITIALMNCSAAFAEMTVDPADTAETFEPTQGPIKRPPVKVKASVSMTPGGPVATNPYAHL
jgi:hypothetical protein